MTNIVEAALGGNSDDVPLFDKIADRKPGLLNDGEERRRRGPNPSSTIIRAALKTPNLSADEEISLCRDRNKSANRDKLVSAHIKLAVKRASVFFKSYNGSLAFEDLLSEGVIALYAAAKCFDPTKGVRFNTYARRAIDNAHKTYAREHFGAVKYPRGAAAKRADSLNAPAYADGLDESEESAQDYLTLDSNRIIDHEGRADSSYLDAEESRLQDEVNVFGAQILSEVAKRVLDDRKMYVFNARHLSDKHVTLDELGSVLRLAGERVRQIDLLAVAKVRAALKTAPTLNDQKIIEHLSRVYLNPPRHYRAFDPWLDNIRGALPKRLADQVVTPQIRLAAHRLADGRRHEVGDENLDWIRKLYRLGHSPAEIEARTRRPAEFIDRMLKKIDAEERAKLQEPNFKAADIIPFPQRRADSFSIVQLGRAA